MSPDWKDQLKHVYKNLQQDQKNKKGLQSKFDKVVGYKNKKGFNDTGIPLTAKAAKSLSKNKAAYRGRYVGTTLQQINDERAAAARDRWKHLKTDHSTDKARNKNKYSVSEMIWRSSAQRDRKDGGSNQRSTFQGYGYGDTPVDDGSVEIDLGSYREKPVQVVLPNIDENKFPKVAEAIWNAKRGKNK